VTKVPAAAGLWRETPRARSMRRFKVAKTDLAFDGVTIAEYLTFTEVMRQADINLFVQERTRAPSTDAGARARA